MHIPDGFIDGKTALATAALSAVGVGVALRQVKRELPPRRIPLLGLAAACGYALTAALMKEAVSALSRGPVAFFETWQLYGVAIAGVGSLFLLQNALQAGTLVASQPMLTVGDALISITYGVLLYGEQLRLGWFLIPEIVALILIVIGYIEIAKSPVAMANDEVVQPSPPVSVNAPANAGQAGQAGGRGGTLGRSDGEGQSRAEAEPG